MAYTKQNFQSGETLYASELNAMDTQIYDNTEKISELEKALENSMVEYAESVEWLDANGDKDRTYYLPDGYEYTYRPEVVKVIYNANTADGDHGRLVDQFPGGSYGDGYPAAKDGVLTSALIPIDPTTMSPGATKRDQSLVKIAYESESGEEIKIYPLHNKSSIWTDYYRADGTRIFIINGAVTAGIDTDGEITLPLSYQLCNTAHFAASNWADVAGIRVSIGINPNGKVTEEQLNKFKFIVDYGEKEVYSWYSTGKLHSDDPAVQEIANNIAILTEDVDELTVEVAAIKESAGSVTVNTSEVLYAVGDSITYGSIVGGNANAWPTHLIALNGYDATNSKNLGIVGIGFCKPASGGQTVRTVVDGQNFSGADIVTVAIGINDWTANYPNAVTVADFFSEMYYCLNKIRTENPYCRIFYILPFNFKIGSFDTFYALGYKGEGDASLCYGNTLQQFVNKIKAKFEEDEWKALNIHVIDMSKTPAITRYNLTTTLGDGLHPTAECHKELAKEIARRIALA